MIGVKPGRDVAPTGAVLNRVPDAGLAAARLEAVAVAVGRPCHARVDVTVAHGPRVFDRDGHFLIDEIVAVVRVPPGAATADNRARAALLIMHAEAVGVLSVAL